MIVVAGTVTTFVARDTALPVDALPLVMNQRKPFASVTSAPRSSAISFVCA